MKLGILSQDIKLYSTSRLYSGSTEWVEPKILEIKELLDNETVPDSNENCDTCSYVSSVNSV